MTDIQIAHAELMARGYGWMRACHLVADRYKLTAADVELALRRAQDADRRDERMAA